MGCLMLVHVLVVWLCVVGRGSSLLTVGRHGMRGITHQTLSNSFARSRCVVITMSKDSSTILYRPSALLVTNSDQHEQSTASSPVSTVDSNKSSPAMTYMQTMTAGALSRSMASTLLHPVHTYKTLLQTKHVNINLQEAGLLLSPASIWKLWRGIDAQFLLSIPHGAFHFFVIDYIKAILSTVIHSRFHFLADFSSSALSTIVCSIISTPQMVLTDRLMAGQYANVADAVMEIARTHGWRGFYQGWAPSLAQKIPSYGLTWMFFEQLKSIVARCYGPSRVAMAQRWNFALGALAAACSVTVMIPLDTIKTRLVLQTQGSADAYVGIWDCAIRIWREEGWISFYRSLLPRLISVVPMIAIQFGVYEAIKARYLLRNRRNFDLTRDRPSTEHYSDDCHD